MRCFHQAFDSGFNRPPLAEIVHGSLVAPKIDRDNMAATTIAGRSQPWRRPKRRAIHDAGMPRGRHRRQRARPFALKEPLPACATMAARGHERPGRAGSGSGHVRFSNRPFRVKHFQTIRRCSVDVAHGLALLFGIGAKALPLWDSRMRWSNLCSGLAVRRNGRSKRTCELTSSIVPRGTSSTARWSSSFLLLDLIL